MKAEQINRKQWARGAGLDRYQTTTLLQMFEYYERHGFYGNPRVLAMLLGRPPTSFAQFLGSLHLG